MQKGVYVDGVYTPPDYFPEFMQHRNYAARRLYCERVLIELANAGRLRLTDIITQPATVANTCGDVILGRVIDPDGRYMSGEPIPDELQAYSVTIETLPNKAEAYMDEYDNQQTRPLTIRYTDGQVEAASAVVRARSGAQNELYGPHRVRQIKPRVIETGAQRKAMSLREAWLTLKRHGQFCAFGQTARDRGRNWLYREAEPTSAKRKPQQAEERAQ